jgi:hypothetical protein
MLKPISNPKLSLRAKALFYHFAEKGRVISADELRASQDVMEGRDAIQAAINELKDFRYIKTVRVRNNNQWVSQLKFTDEAVKLMSLNNGFSGHLYIDNYTTTSDITTSTNIDTVTNVTVSIEAQAPLKEETVAWNLDGEEETPLSKSQIRRLAIMRGEDVVGAVGNIEDRQARLNAKYKKPVKAQRYGEDRINTPEELWSTSDLVSEFYDLSDKANHGMSDQVNSQTLSTWINKKVGEGTERVVILKGIRMFFADPRNLHDVGSGKPLWQRFFAYYQTTQAQIKGTTKKIYVDEDFLAQQEKMMRLLEGE